MTRQQKPFPRPAGTSEPDELYAPIEWSTAEVEQLRRRVRELVGTGIRRSEASRIAFGELIGARAAARARPQPEPPAAA